MYSFNKIVSACFKLKFHTVKKSKSCLANLNITTFLSPSMRQKHIQATHLLYHTLSTLQSCFLAISIRTKYVRQTNKPPWEHHLWPQRKPAKANRTLVGPKCLTGPDVTTERDACIRMSTKYSIILYIHVSLKNN